LSTAGLSSAGLSSARHRQAGLVAHPRQSEGRSARGHRGRSARIFCPGAAAWVLPTRHLCWGV
jgi:hypothetical protein